MHTCRRSIVHLFIFIYCFPFIFVIGPRSARRFAVEKESDVSIDNIYYQRDYLCILRHAVHSFHGVVVIFMTWTCYLFVDFPSFLIRPPPPLLPRDFPSVLIRHFPSLILHNFWLLTTTGPKQRDACVQNQYGHHLFPSVNACPIRIYTPQNNHEEWAGGARERDSGRERGERGRHQISNPSKSTVHPAWPNGPPLAGRSDRGARKGTRQHRGISLMSNRPPLGPDRRTVPGALWGP